MTTRNNAAREAWGYQVQGAGYGADASLRDSWSPSYIGAGTSLLMGSSSIADKWKKFQDTNLFGSSYDLSKDTMRTAGDRDLGGYYS